MDGNDEGNDAKAAEKELLSGEICAHFCVFKTGLCPLLFGLLRVDDSEKVGQTRKLAKKSGQMAIFSEKSGQRTVTKMCQNG